MKKKEKYAGSVKSPQIEFWKKDKHIKLPPYLLNITVLFVILSLMGLKTEHGSPSGLTSKQLNQKSSSLSYVPKGGFSWMACNDDYTSRHINAIWFSPVNTAQFSLIRHSTVQPTSSRSLHHYKNNFSNYKAKKRDPSILIIILRLERCMLSWISNKVPTNSCLKQENRSFVWCLLLILEQMCQDLGNMCKLCKKIGCLNCKRKFCLTTKFYVS